nr:hypothetical protein [Tanacetum cinerariifolium]
MDPNSSVGNIFLGEDNHVSLNDRIESHGEWETPKCRDTTSSKQKKEAKAFILYRMETEEISERYIAHYFLNGLEAYDGEINLEQDKNLISSKFVVKLCLEHEVEDGDKVVKTELIVALRDFENGVITIYLELDPFLDNSNETKKSKDDWELILDGIDFGYIPELEETSLPTFVCKMRKSARNKKRTFENYQMNYSDEGSDRYKKIMDSIFLDKLKLDSEIKSEEAIKKVMGESLKEKEDPGAFVIPIRLEEKIDLNGLAGTGSNIIVMPFCIYSKLGRDEVKLVNRGITMLSHSKAKPMGVWKDMLCQVRVTTIIAKFLIMDMHVDKEVPILFGRGFLYTCGSILDTIERTTSTFDGICHQKFRAAKTNVTIEESDNKDDEDYYIKRNSLGRTYLWT